MRERSEIRKFSEISHRKRETPEMNVGCCKMYSSCSGLNMIVNDDDALTLHLSFRRTPSRRSRASLVNPRDDRRNLLLVGVEEAGLSAGHLGGVEHDGGRAREAGGDGRRQGTGPLLRGKIRVRMGGGTG